MKDLENLHKRYFNKDGTEKTLQQIIVENINISEKLRCDIYKEDDIFKMLDMSLLCISLMADDKAFYKQNKEKLVKSICLLAAKK